MKARASWADATLIDRDSTGLRPGVWRAVKLVVVWATVRAKLPTGIGGGMLTVS